MAKLKTKLTAALLSLVTLTASPLGAFKAAADSTGKYVSEVYIAYGKTESDAKKWLTDNGWEPVGGNLNAGKLSFWDKAEKVAAVMGIHRTNNAEEAVTDMAVMNMKGGYSFQDYQILLDEKKTEINAFLDTYVPVLKEYRDNYNGKGSPAGKARADLAHELLNRFYDGDPNGEYAVNDTGKPLGDLLLKETSHELGDQYENMTDKAEHADLTQILLESSGVAVLAVEQALAMAADTAKTTWLERLTKISGVSLANVVKDYVPEARGQNLSPSAAKSLMQSQFGDAAAALAAGYGDVQQDLYWYLSFIGEKNLVQEEDESDEDYSARIEAYFDALKETDEDYYQDAVENFNNTARLYYTLESVEYEGEWGETLLDFFIPESEAYYGSDADNFLPFAAVLSEGQRAGLEFLSLYALLRIGAGTEEAAKETLPDVQEIFKDAESISVYSGINRAIFRDGVALTSQAKMQKNMGKTDWFDSAFDWNGMGNMIAYAGAVAGISAIIGGAMMLSKSNGRGGWFYISIEDTKLLRDQTKLYKTYVEETQLQVDLLVSEEGLSHADAVKEVGNEIGIKNMKAEVSKTRSEIFNGSYGRWLTALGGVILLATAGFEIAQLAKYYNCTFTEIPMLIVDEADIVSYLTDKDGNPILDEKGNQKKNIDFDQYVYYDVVKSNRQAVGQIGDWQNGVSDYKKWGCGDAADLNCDCGKQWLAMYVNKSPEKGNPILANSLTYQTGSSKTPANCTRGLHYFCYDYAMNIADEAYAYNDDKGGIYLFWNEDAKAYNTASAFSKGQLALAGIGGLAVGIFGATAVMLLTNKRRKDEPEAPAAA